MQQTILEVGALHLDVVGELEAPLEAAPGDAAAQELPLFFVGFLFARSGEGLLLDVDLELVLAEPGHRHGDPVLVVAKALNVIGGVGHAVGIKARSTVQKIEQSVEANGGTVEGGQIEVSHHESSLRSDCGYLPARKQRVRPAPRARQR